MYNKPGVTKTVTPSTISSYTMGRKSTGAWETGECLRIELSYLLRKGYLVHGKITSGKLSWSSNGNPSGNINIVSSWPADRSISPSIRLMYILTDRETGEKEERDDTIYLVRQSSNLGKGEVLYFICPINGNHCRILYKAYNSSIWKSRQSYKNRIYYPSQKTSKRGYYCERYWQLDKQIKRLETPQRRSSTYLGKPTKRAERLAKMEEQQMVFESLMWSPEAMTLGLRRAVFSNLPGYEHLKKRAKGLNKT